MVNPTNQARRGSRRVAVQTRNAASGTTPVPSARAESSASTTTSIGNNGGTRGPWASCA